MDFYQYGEAVQRSKRRLTTSTRCPDCGSRGRIRMVTFGFMPFDGSDDREVIEGGCEPGHPDSIGCLDCGWRGIKSELPDGRKLRGNG